MTDESRALIADLAAKNPKAAELAVVVSLAARIEPELLRAARGWKSHGATSGAS